MKDFDSWNNLKKTTHESGEHKWCNERDVWWCHLGTNIGFEQDGKGEARLRPVLVVKKFNQFVCLVVPLSTKLKKNRYYIEFNNDKEVPSAAIISQIRLIDTKRLFKRESKLPQEDFARIKKAIMQFFA